MKITRLFFSLSVLIFLTHCQSPSDQINKAFETVGKSLERSNIVLSDSFEGIYLTINSVRQKNEPLAIKADTIYFLTKQANNFIDSLKATIQLRDPSGINLNMAKRLLVLTPTSETLRKLLLNVYANSNSYAIHNPKQDGLDSALQPLQEIKNNTNWTKINFEKTPTIAAITMLRKL